VGLAGRRIAREELEAQERARQIVSTAEVRALEIAREVAARAEGEARALEHAKVAALYLALHAKDERRAELDIDRAIALAKLLAERLIGKEIEQDPDIVLALARQTLAEARGARRARIEAHPLDVDVLRAHLEALGLSAEAAEIAPAPELSRGSLVLHTDVGTIDAKLAPQLDRLAAALREALSDGVRAP
jgi:flagellar biosynthesis/type III secretory pathway protein FliH